MSDQQPVLSSINLFVNDMPATVAFYRRLGLSIAAGAEDHVHVQTAMPNGLQLEFDTVELTKSYDPDWEAPASGSRNTFQFMLPSRQAVDDLYAGLTAAGYTGHLAPFDAFWRARYAAVEDPDGNLVGLTSAQDPQQSGPVPGH